MKTASATVRNLVFDFGGVLLPISEEKTWEAFTALGALSSLPDQKKLFESFEKGSLSKDEFLSGLQGHFFRKSIFKGDLAQAWCAMCDQAIPEASLRFLQKQRRRGFKLFLLSNTNALHVAKIRERSGPFDYQQFLRLFDGVYYSQEVGLRKPQKKIYQQLLDTHGLTAKACFYVDDKRENLKPAKSLGMKTWHLNRDEMDFEDLKKEIAALPTPAPDIAQ